MNGLTRGLIGWFDILGFKAIIENNEIEKSVLVVKKIQETIEKAATKLKATQDLIGPSDCDYVLFSDTILVYCPGIGHTNTAVFAEFSASLVSDLFWNGLPVRGAWAHGDYYIDAEKESITLAGLPILEAQRFAEALELAACVLAPSAEAILAKKQILGTANEQFGFVKRSVPLKGLQRQELFMLNHYPMDIHYNPTRQITRSVVLEQFAAHGKRVTVEVLPKINNTLEFLINP